MLTKLLTIASLASAVVLTAAGAAYAADPWGNVDCGQTSYTGCQLGAGEGGSSGPERPARPNHSGTQGNHGNDAESPQPGDRITDAPKDAADCSYVRSDYQPPASGTTNVSHRPNPGSGGTTLVAYRPAAAQFIQQGGQPGGAWYVWRCSGPGTADALYRLPVWIPDGQAPGAPALPSPQELAQQAYNQLRLPSPGIRANPVGDQLVNLPTWLWIDGSTFGPQSATASVPGVSVTATATPQTVTWNLGDGTSVTCRGAGTPFPSGGDPVASSPDCGHTYKRSSLGRPGNAFPVYATVHWSVTWSGAGQGGTFPGLTTAGTSSFVVLESQALNRN
ncbi:hypothetical protein SAMN05421835_123119 [Amycolatopsis sacchari]|uniref:PKD domain-containing protein n=1 Tax=Amycolatopsis sacchari TaxID=115433 RepID=A0A1I4ABU7_9PSEU|nr:hypothetical protein SAMN05421835_123119 [Amycolatopsis sacchari]